MTIEQIIVIAVVQGITEFLPISSSGHLVLVPYMFHWPDQGQFVDVMVHVGTLFAILIYFWRDVWKITLGGLELFRGKVTPEGKLAIYIVLATIPAVAFGLFLKKFGIGEMERSVTIVAWNTVIFGILMLVADMMGKQEKTIEDMTLKNALIVGVAQAFALIRHQPLGHYHDRRALSQLHAPRCGAVLVPIGHSGHRWRWRADGRRSWWPMMPSPWMRSTARS